MIIEGLEISVFAICEGRTNVVQIVGDHTQADPSLHSGVAPVDAATKTMPALQHADSTLATGPPLLPRFEPALLLFALPLGAFCGATRNAHPLDTSLMRGRFILS